MTEHRKNYLKVWRFENAGKCRKQKREWAVSHPWIGRSNVLKWLSKHPERSLFPTFVSLDEHPGWIDEIPSPWPDPLQMLMIKESLVTQ